MPSTIHASNTYAQDLSGYRKSLCVCGTLHDDALINFAKYKVGLDARWIDSYTDALDDAVNDKVATALIKFGGDIATHGQASVEDVIRRCRNAWEEGYAASEAKASSRSSQSQSNKTMIEAYPVPENPGTYTFTHSGDLSNAAIRINGASTMGPKGNSMPSQAPSQRLPRVSLSSNIPEHSDTSLRPSSTKSVKFQDPSMGSTVPDGVPRAFNALAPGLQTAPSSMATGSNGSVLQYPHGSQPSQSRSSQVPDMMRPATMSNTAGTGFDFTSGRGSHYSIRNHSPWLIPATCSVGA